MESFGSLLTEVAPAIIAAGSLLWSFSKQITKIEAKLQTLTHAVKDCKDGIEGNRQGRIEVFGVINNILKPKDNEVSERLARLEEKALTKASVDPKDVYTRIAKLESRLDSLEKDLK